MVELMVRSTAAQMVSDKVEVMESRLVEQKVALMGMTTAEKSAG